MVVNSNVLTITGVNWLLFIYSGYFVARCLDWYLKELGDILPIPDTASVA